MTGPSGFVSSPFEPDTMVHDVAFLFGGEIPPEVAKRIHVECLPELDRLARAETVFFVIGSYAGRKKRRVEAVRDQLSNLSGAEAFLLEELDPDVDVWENFYVKFRVFLARCHYVVGVFEDNDGGHELEIGEADLSTTFVLKRDYREASIDDDVEYEKYDAMLATLFDLLDRRGHLRPWTTEAELADETRRLGAALGSREPP